MENIEKALIDALGEHYKPWHLIEVKRIVSESTFTEEEVIKAVIKKIKRTKHIK